MKTFALAVAAAAVVTLSAFANPAKAITLSGSDGLRHAIEDTDLTDKVHCRPGVWHHRFRPHDGCFRRYPYYGSYNYYEPGYAYGPGYYGPGVGFYGPGVGFRFGFGGHRRHW